MSGKLGSLAMVADVTMAIQNGLEQQMPWVRPHYTGYTPLKVTALGNVAPMWLRCKEVTL